MPNNFRDVKIHKTGLLKTNQVSFRLDAENLYTLIQTEALNRISDIDLKINNVAAIGT